MHPEPAIDLRAREEYASSDELTFRQRASALRLLRAALGGPAQWEEKLRRAGRTVALYADRAELRRRLDRFRDLGYIDELPTPLQLGFGALDMLRFFIVPGADDYYRTRGIDFRFHQLLRFLEDPVSVIDPIGLLSERDTIIGHLLQVVHANPIYDLQLLAGMFEDGLDELERQTEAAIAGTHGRAATLAAVVEDAEYHLRLLGYIREYRRNPLARPLLRRDGGIRQDPNFVLAEATFGTLPGFLRYARRLPTSPAALLRHRRRPTLDPRHCDPEVVEAHRRLFPSRGPSSGQV